MATDDDAAMPPPIPTADTFTHFQDTLFSRVVATVKTAGAIAASDVSFQRSSDPAFNEGLDEVSARILGLANQLLRAAARGSDIATPPRMRDVDDVENGWGEVVEVVDYLLEKAVCMPPEERRVVEEREESGCGEGGEWIGGE